MRTSENHLCSGCPTLPGNYIVQWLSSYIFLDRLYNVDVYCWIDWLHSPYFPFRPYILPHIFSYSTLASHMMLLTTVDDVYHRPSRGWKAFLPCCCNKKTIDSDMSGYYFTVPQVGRSSAVMIFMVVVFPAPLWPSSPNTSPPSTAKLSRASPAFLALLVEPFLFWLKQPSPSPVPRTLYSLRRF